MSLTALPKHAMAVWVWDDKDGHQIVKPITEDDFIVMAKKIKRMKKKLGP